VARVGIVTYRSSSRGKRFLPAEKVKNLGLMLNKELQFRAHLAEKAGKVNKVALALCRLRGLEPTSVKQLAKCSVLPVAGYASPI
jgi:hypothetical protein